MKDGDPSLEYPTDPGVFTLSLIPFSTHEPEVVCISLGFPSLVWKLLLAHLPGAQAEASGDPLLVHKGLDNLFSLSLECSCSSPQQVSCFCCAWKGLWFHFSCLPHLSWAGFVFLFILPGAEQPLPFTSLIFTPLFFPASKSGGNPTTQSLQKPSQTQNFCPPVTITHRFLFCIFLQL